MSKYFDSNTLHVEQTQEVRSIANLRAVIDTKFYDNEEEFVMWYRAK